MPLCQAPLHPRVTNAFTLGMKVSTTLIYDSHPIDLLLALKINRQDPDFHQKYLEEAILNGAYLHSQRVQPQSRYLESGGSWRLVCLKSNRECCYNLFIFSSSPALLLPVWTLVRLMISDHSQRHHLSPYMVCFSRFHLL